MIFKDWCKKFEPDVKKFYKTHLKRTLNLHTPVLFTEKIQWLKIYDSTLLKSYCADKINIHNYCIQKLGKDICIPILFTYKTPNDIDFSKLPRTCVIKCNHGSGMNIVVTDKQKLNIDNTRLTLESWLSTNFAFSNGYEMHYYPIHRMILVEPLLDDLSDVKFFCFNGKVKFIQIDKHFSENRLNFYDRDWQPMTWLSNTKYPADYSSLDSRPEKLTEMIQYAEQLSSDFKFVRVDMYAHKHDILLGELTFTPGSGKIHYAGDGDKILGKTLDLQ